MRKQFSYSDAVRLLEPVDSKVIAALGKIAGGALLATAAFGLPQALALLEVRTEIAELGQQLVVGLGEKLSGRTRYDRTERLLAAHSIIVITAFFAALAETEFPFDLTLRRSDQLAITTGHPMGAGAGAWIATLAQSSIPVPTAQAPFEDTIRQVTTYYHRLFEQLTDFVRGLAAWDSADAAKRDEFVRSERDIVRAAVYRYEELYRCLAADCLEFFFWANLQDHRATRAKMLSLGSDIGDRLRAVESQLGSLRTGFGALTSLVGQISSIGKLSRTRDDLRRVYKRQLNEPAADFDTSGGPRVPPLSTAYINPRCRIRTAAAASQPSNESAWCLPGDEMWWDLARPCDDLQGFLIGFLTGPEAVAGPLVVLGQPGSGKSVFTRVLAASLSSGDFLPIRVELRRVPANAPIQSQIEHAVRDLTGASMDWPDLVLASNGALPVILLDGFDELLQATQISKSDYLEQVRDFQRREEYLGHPAAVIVTSRLAVADRARFPEETVVIRLEEFNESQVGRWVANWNAANADFFARSGLATLPIQPILAHADLSAQPLLLLMLALYDSESNALQRVGMPLSGSELYEELLTNFARREVVRQHANLPVSQIAQLVDLELDRLAVFACAMFNRSAQSATEQQLTTDLESLLPEAAQTGADRRAEGNLTAAQLAVGRFYFFVYESQASYGRDEARAYEFVHATFAEYLVARIVARVLKDLSQPQSGATALLGGRSRPEADLLHALLSFVPLTTRSSVVSFLEDLTGKIPASDRERARRLLAQGLNLSPQLRPDRPFASYAPAALSAAARQAAYTANLVIVLTVISEPRETAVTELFPIAADPIQAWRSSAYLWKSQLPPSQWQALIAVLRVQRHRDALGRQELRLTLGTDAESPAPRVRDLSWWSGGELASLQQASPRVQDQFVAQLLREAWFLCDPTLDYLVHAIDPLVDEAGPQIGRTVSIDGAGVVSMANVLAWLRMSSHHTWRPPDLLQLYQAYLDGLASGGPQETAYSTDVLAAQLCEDLVMLPPEVQIAFAQSALRMSTSGDEKDRGTSAGGLRLISFPAGLSNSEPQVVLDHRRLQHSLSESTREALLWRLTRRAVVNLDSLIAQLRKQSDLSVSGHEQATNLPWHRSATSGADPSRAPRPDGKNGRKGRTGRKP